MTSIGRSIVKLRKQRGWTQSGLAEAASLSASAIAMYETDRRTPDAGSLAKLAAALEVDAEQLTAKQRTASKTASRSSGKQKPHKASRQPAKDEPAQVSSAQQAGAIINTLNPEMGGDFGDGTNQLTLTREEARIILFLRMNPQAMPFFQSYITAGNQRRFQLEKAWRLINEFQN